MFDWLFEGWLAVYLVLATIAALLLVLWWQTRNRKLLPVVGLVAFLAMGYFVLDRLVETDREKLPRIVKEMAAAAKAHKIDDLFEHISEGLHTPPGKQHLREQAARYINSVKDIQLSELEVRSLDREQGTATVRFNMKITGDGLPLGAEIPFSYELKFQRENGQWRMTKVDVFKLNTTDPVPLPF